MFCTIEDAWGITNPSDRDVLYPSTLKEVKKSFGSLSASRELQSNNNIEGTQNLNLNMNDINGMLSDTDLRVLQGNYSYIMWSILAVGILTITINTMRK